MHQLRLSSTRERSWQKEKNHQKGQDAKTDTAYVSVNRVIISLRTTDVSPRSSPLIASHAGVFRGTPLKTPAWEATPLRDVSRGGTSATQWQKFHTDDVNQCLHNKSGSHGVPDANLFNFTFLLVDFGEVLCSSANQLQQKSNATFRKDYIPQILTVLLDIHRLYIWPLRPFVSCLSFVNNS